MKKSFLTISVSLLLGLQFLFAQSYEVAGIEKSDKEDMQYEVLGKVGARYWIYKNVGGIATIAQYNDRMQLVKQKKKTCRSSRRMRQVSQALWSRRFKAFIATL